MNFSAKRDDLNRVLSRVQSIVERRPAVPVLSNVKITAGGGRLKFVATDMDICLEESINADTGPEKDSITLPAVTLYEIIRKLPSNIDVAFTKVAGSADSVQISADSSEFSLPAIDPSEFPSFEDAASTSYFEIQSDVFQTLLTRTKHAMSYDETRYYLNGIYIHPSADDDSLPVLATVATDGHRMAMGTAALPAGAQEMPGIILPRKAVLEIVKLLDGYDGIVGIGLSTRKATLTMGSATITTKLIDGKFPDYKRVIPKSNPRKMVVNTKNMISAIELVTAVAMDKTKTVRLTISQNQLVIKAISEINGNARGEQNIEISSNSDSASSISFNSKYLLEALAVIEGPMTTITFDTGAGAVAIFDENDINFLHVLMPMQ